MPPEPSKKQSHNFSEMLNYDLDQETLAKLKEVIEEKKELEKHIANMRSQIDKGINEIKKWEDVISSNSIEITSLAQQQQLINKLINKLKVEEEKKHFSLTDKQRITSDIANSKVALKKVHDKIKFLTIENYQLRGVLDEAKLEDDVTLLKERLNIRVNDLNMINDLIQQYLSQDKKKMPDVRSRMAIAG